VGDELLTVVGQQPDSSTTAVRTVVIGPVVFFLVSPITFGGIERRPELPCQLRSQLDGHLSA
jgi:hypothetical protein